MLGCWATEKLPYSQIYGTKVGLSLKNGVNDMFSLDFR